jgi:hypothetical protein
MFLVAHGGRIYGLRNKRRGLSLDSKHAHGVTTMALKFFYNGIKDVPADNRTARTPLQTCWYNISKRYDQSVYAGAGTGYPEGTISIYAREYCYGTYPDRWVGFSKGVKDAFKVENDTDYMSDYHAKDHIRVTPDHPLYAEVLEAYEKALVHGRGMEIRA